MKIKIAVLFGGRSTEHEVSIISGIQVLHALDKQKYEVFPIYITKSGEWELGDLSFYNAKTFKKIDLAIAKKRLVILTNSGEIIEKPKQMTFLKNHLIDKVDVVFPVFHGRFGEDGSIQGLFECFNIPFVGCGVAASSVGMDKVLSKHIAKVVGIPTLGYLWFSIEEWKKERKNILSKISKELSFPVYVKPARLGSTIGLTKVNHKSDLESALEVGFYYDTKVMIEQGLENAKEINISLLGNYPPYQFSAAEQPVKSEEILSFEDKYISTGNKSKGMASSKRILPAKIKKETLQKIEDYARLFFSEIGGKGFARIDFLLTANEQKIYFNEINTMPGSVAFYLWKEAKISFDKLVDKLVQLAIDEYNEKSKITYTFSSNILEGFEGTKAAKG